MLSTVSYLVVIYNNLLSRAEILLSGNPWDCDCRLLWLLTPEESIRAGARVDDSVRARARVEDLDSITCSSGKPAISLKKEEMLCSYSTHCVSQCSCCDFFACDCRMQCPSLCSCFHSSTWSVNTVRCSSRGHSDVPALIPMDATQVRLDGNNMTELLNPGFIGRRRIRSLFLNNSMITELGELSLQVTNLWGILMKQLDML